MVLIGIGIVLAFYQAKSKFYYAMMISIVLASINIYVFICIYSLYELLKNKSSELNTGNVTQSLAVDSEIYSIEKNNAQTV